MSESAFDPIAMEVFTNRLLSITEDMNNTLVRSSFSTNIKERKDCSVALFDAAGRRSVGVGKGRGGTGRIGLLSAALRPRRSCRSRTSGWRWGW